MTVTQVRDHDAALVERVADGDEAALRTLYDHFSPTLHAVAYRITQNRSDTEEVVTESFAQVWRDAARFRETRGSVAAWLTMIARSRAIDTVRARRRREQIADRATQAAETGVSMAEATSEAVHRRAEENERRQHVHAALKELSEEQRQVIELAYFGGHSHSEIAKQLDVPLGTIKTRIRSGMQLLRQRLRPLFADTNHAQ